MAGRRNGNPRRKCKRKPNREKTYLQIGAMPIPVTSVGRQLTTLLSSRT